MYGGILMMADEILIAITSGVIGVLFTFYLILNILGKKSGNAKMQEIAKAIQQGAVAFLNRQYRSVGILVLVLAVILAVLLNITTAITFVIGAVLSAVAGYIGMMISVRANVRTSQAASSGLGPAFKLAFNGGVVTGIGVVSLGLLGVSILYMILKDPVLLIGFGVGASLISLFARVGGGIYTKGADVGADLVGKIEKNIPEDDPRNPAVIADNVGDNVGDCAGMAADLFESYTVTIIATMLLGAAFNDIRFVLFPLVLAAIGLLASIIATFFVSTNSVSKIWSALNRGIWISAILSAIAFYFITDMIFQTLELFYAALVGIIVTVLISNITDYYTSTSKKPVRDIAEAAKTGPATTVISGLSVGMMSTLWPIIILAISIFLSYSLGGFYGVAIAATAMLTMTGIIVSVDAFGPITDNAGGIAEMSNMPAKVRKVTDALDAVGNTTKAVTKGFAIVSAGLAALSLFAAYAEEVKVLDHLDGIPVLNIYDPAVVVGMFIGGVLPFIFSAMTMKAVGNAAFLMVQEVRRQFKTINGIMSGKAKPDYARCVDISTKAALKELVMPGVIAVSAPLLVGFILGPEALGGLLAGVIVSGLLLAITMTTAGAAWDNAKKLIETGVNGGKGSEAHKAAVVGDTIGDPFKDTSGPALNPLIKVINTVALLAAGLIANYHFF